MGLDLYPDSELLYIDEKQKTVEEIRDMISKDVDSVTDAFADLIMKKRREQLQQQLGSLAEAAERPSSSTAAAVPAASLTADNEADTKGVDEEFLQGPFHSLSSSSEDGEVFTPQLPHPILDPPKAVQGQLLRYWSKEEHDDHHHGHHAHEEEHDEADDDGQEFR